MNKSFVLAAGLAASFPVFPAFSATPVTNNGFNPALSLILSGQAVSFSRDSSHDHIPGFVLGDEAASADQGFSLGESELTASANVDDQFYGQFTLSIGSDNQSSVEEAYIQTLNLPNGFSARFGRFKSGVGYLNGQHSHVWDFTDAPLPYRALLNNQYGDDGVQVTWLAPTDIFLELGSEVFRGQNFPAANAAHQGAGAYSVYAHIGGDVGTDHAWTAGLSRLTANADARETGDQIFTGTDHINIANFIWKWAPNGNSVNQNFKFQTEYLWGDEKGSYADVGDINVNRRGWYAQAVYQWMPRWRAGVRYDQVSSNDPGVAFAATDLSTTGSTSKRTSMMVDFSNSEFSLLRLQLSRDESSSQPNNAIFLQYLMSLGTHGAHNF